MKLKKNRLILLATSVLWLLMVGTGTAFLWNYESTPGTAAIAPDKWPADSHIQLDTTRPTLIMLAHPHCPCTRASIGELARLMTQTQGKVTAYVIFVKPSGFSTDWEKTDLWSKAAAIPGVNVLLDDKGVEARRFHTSTSGQTMLYDKGGKLLFSGGITSARGHSGDNAGRTAIVSLLTKDEAQQTETSVFGCPLFAQNSKDSECRMKKDDNHATHKH